MIFSLKEYIEERAVAIANYIIANNAKRLPISLWITKNTKASLICVKIKIHSIIYLHIVI